MKYYTVQKQVTKCELWNAKIGANSPEEAERLVREGYGDWLFTCHMDDDEEILNVDVLDVNGNERELNNE